MMPDHINILIASDHLMHIDEESVAEIVELIGTKWQPDYILLREVKASGHEPDRKYPRLHHKLDFPGYKNIFERDSIGSPEMYFIRLLAR